MPTYEYVCRRCGHQFESFQSIKADPIRTCPACKAKAVERKIGIGSGVLFKGGGFYETDYRSEGYTKAAEAERKASEPAAPAAAEPAGGGTGGSPKPTVEAAKRPAEGSPAQPSSKPTERSPASADPPSKATHPSRIGRGSGNMIDRPPQPKSSGAGLGGGMSSAAGQRKPKPMPKPPATKPSVRTPRGRR
jgi:putative FmdB family regulatory protein